MIFVTNLFIVALLITFLLFQIFHYILTRAPIDEHRNYWVLFTISLPLSTVINLGIKGPIFNFLIQDTSTQLTWELIIFIPLIVALSEEAIKLTPLIIPRLRDQMSKSQLSQTWTGWALGFGFGVGEAWFIASNLLFSTEYQQYSIIDFMTGFGLERVMVAFGHAAFTMIALKGVNSLKQFFITLSLAISYHFIVNFPILLHQAGKISAIEFYGIYIIVVFTMPLIAILLLIDTLNAEKSHFFEEENITN